MNKLLSCACRSKKSAEIRTLDFRNRHLVEVPADAFKNEATLEVLLLDDNKLTELRKELLCCRSLFKLSLSNNGLQCLPPSIGSLCNLGELNLKNNCLVELPDEIKACRYLHTLDLSGNLFEVLPEDISSLSHLANLLINQCSLRKLPNTLGRLSSLCVLEVRDNKLKSLPACIGRLKKLERLDVGENELDCLPESFGELPCLCDCWLDKNQLTGLPASIGQLANLSFCDLAANRLETLPAELGLCVALCDLNLSDNLLRTLPDSLEGLAGLAGLRLDGNRLAQLPHSLGRLPALCDLNLSHNQLGGLPASLGLLRQLQTLHADGNRLTELPQSIGNCASLTILSVRQNLLRFVPEEIGRLQELRVLNLSANRLECLPISLLRLPALQALWLSDNQTERMPRLQPDDVPTGRGVLRVLTCYLLPQLPVPLATLAEEEEATDFSGDRNPRTVQFALDTEGSGEDGGQPHLPKDVPDRRRGGWGVYGTAAARMGLRCLPCVASNSSSLDSGCSQQQQQLPQHPRTDDSSGGAAAAVDTDAAAKRQNPLELVSPLSTSSPLSNGGGQLPQLQQDSNNNNATCDAYEVVVLQAIFRPPAPQDATPAATVRLRPAMGGGSDPWHPQPLGYHHHLLRGGYDSDGGIPHGGPAVAALRRGSHPGPLPPLAQAEPAGLTPPPPPPPPPPRHLLGPGPVPAPLAAPEDSASSDSGYGCRRGPPPPQPPPARSPPPPPRIHAIPPAGGIRVPTLRTPAGLPASPPSDASTGSDHRLMWVTLERSPTLGFSVSGGADTQEGGVFVSRVTPNSPAWWLLRSGDRILQVNDLPFDGLCHAEAVHFLKQQDRVRLLLERWRLSEL